MSDDELRQAAERAICLSQTCAPEHSESEENTLLRQLGDAVLAEHPADDGEPVTEEWLLSIGFERRCFTDRGMSWHHGRCRWELNINHDGGHLQFVYCPTRGHVRRLLAALGV